MVRRADNHSVELIAKLAQQLAIIDKLGGILEFLGLGIKSLFINIANSGNPAMVASLVNVRAPFATHTNSSDVQCIVRAESGISPSAIWPYGKSRDCGAEAFEKLTTIRMN